MGAKTKSQLIKRTDLASILEPMDPTSVQPVATKVIFTLGPACQSVEVLCEILMAGATCARIDLTWGPIEFHRKSLQNLEIAMQKTCKLCAVMLDTLGREIFVRRAFQIGPDGWPVHDASFDIQAGQKVTLTTNPDATATAELLPVNYPGLVDMAKVGDTFYIGRYLVTGADAASLYLTVESIEGQNIVCVAVNDAELGGLLTVFHMERSSHDEMTNVQNAQPLLSAYDVETIRTLTQQFEVDFVSLTFVRSGDDVLEAKQVLADMGQAHIKVIAKVETKQAIINFRGVLAACDGIMLSRGNLGLDCQAEKMATIQKQITLNCNMVGKLCILTRICDTMVTAPRPTRAEATDVANAVLDGVDCLLLGAETLRGANPVVAVQTVLDCCHAAEAVFDHTLHFEHMMREATKAEEQGILVPGLLGTPEDSLHGSASQAELQAKARKLKLNASQSHAHLSTQLAAMTHFAGGGSGSNSFANLSGSSAARPAPVSFLSKLEAVASSAVRAAEKAGAKAIIVFTDSGLTASLLAKYRPNVPIITLVVPRLVNKDMRWQLTGKSTARQCLLTRGLLPFLAVPSQSGEKVLNTAIANAAKAGILHPFDHVVCVEKASKDFCIKMISVDATATGVLQSDE